MTSQCHRYQRWAAETRTKVAMLRRLQASVSSHAPSESTPRNADNYRANFHSNDKTRVSWIHFPSLVNVRTCGICTPNRTSSYWDHLQKRSKSLIFCCPESTENSLIVTISMNAPLFRCHSTVTLPKSTVL